MLSFRICDMLLYLLAHKFELFRKLKFSQHVLFVFKLASVNIHITGLRKHAGIPCTCILKYTDTF